MTSIWDWLWIFVLIFEKERDSLGSFYLEGFVLENYWREVFH
jgi:hypothetical protein